MRKLAAIFLLLVSSVLANSLYPFRINDRVFCQYAGPSGGGGGTTTWTDTNSYRLLLEFQTTNSYGFLDTSGNGFVASNVASQVGRVVVGSNQNGRIEYAASFVAANSAYLVVPDNDLLSFPSATGSAPFSIYMWVNQTNTLAQFAGLLSKSWNAGAPDEWIARYDSADGGDLAFYTGNNDFSSYVKNHDGGLPSTNQWTLVTFVNNGGLQRDMIFYYNTNVVSIGDMGNTNATYTGMTNTSADIWIGRFNQYWGGLMGTIGIVPYSLTSNSVVLIYNNTHPTNNIRVR